MAALTTTSLPLSLVARGKVRDVYDAGITEGPHQGALLFVATDRISAFDIILENVSANLEKRRQSRGEGWLITIFYSFFLLETRAFLEKGNYCTPCQLFGFSFSHLPLLNLTSLQQSMQHFLPHFKTSLHLLKIK